jgi:hypothetical protein
MQGDRETEGFLKSLLFVCFAVLCLRADWAAAQTFETVAKNGLWKTECRYNEFMKRRECNVVFDFIQPGAQFIAGKIFVDMITKDVTVFATPRPTGFKVTVDKNRTAQAKCDIGCSVAGKDGAALFQQMLQGTSFTFAVVTEEKTSLERTESLTGFAACVAAAK